MPKLGSSSRSGSSGKRRHPSEKVTTAALEQIPRDLSSLVRGLYGRVARKLHVDPSYVSRVARGERQSGWIEGALRSELNDIVLHVNKKLKRTSQKAPKKNMRRKSKINTRSKSRYIQVQPTVCEPPVLFVRGNDVASFPRQRRSSRSALVPFEWRGVPDGSPLVKTITTQL
jgi:hypothetical protein